MVERAACQWSAKPLIDRTPSLVLSSLSLFSSTVFVFPFSSESSKLPLFVRSHALVPEHIHRQERLGNVPAHTDVINTQPGSDSYL